MKHKHLVMVLRMVASVVALACCMLSMGCDKLDF